MASDVAIAVYVAAGVGAAIGTGFMFQPMTVGSGLGSTNEKTVAAAQAEQDYCQSELSGVNCACFSRMAAHIKTDTRPKVENIIYADKEELARGQAKDTC